MEGDEAAMNHHEVVWCRARDRGSEIPLVRRLERGGWVARLIPCGPRLQFFLVVSF